MRILTAPPVYVSVDGEAQGPFTAEELSALWRAGDLDASALYWFRGMPEWRPVNAFKPPTSGLVAAESVLLTTATAVAGRSIEREVDIVGAEVVLTRDAFSDLAMGFQDMIGGRSATFQKVARDARRMCLEELRADAGRLGADGVIAVSMTYSPVASGNASVMLIATGTAVHLVPPTVA